MNAADMAKLRASSGAKRQARPSGSRAPSASPTPRSRDPEAETAAPSRAAPRPAPKKARLSKGGASSSCPATDFTEVAGGRPRGEAVSVFDDWDVASQVFKSIIRPADAERTTGDGNPHHRRDAITSVLKVCHFIDGYCTLRGQLLEERRKVSSLTKDLEAKDRLIASLQEEKERSQKEKEDAEVLVEGLRAQVAAAGPQAVEAFKASTAYYDEKMAFAEPIFDEVLADTCRRVSARYPDLDLDFVYGPDPSDAPEAGDGADQGPPPT